MSPWTPEMTRWWLGYALAIVGAAGLLAALALATFFARYQTPAARHRALVRLRHHLNPDRKARP